MAWHSFYIQRNEAAIRHWDRCMELAVHRLNPNSLNSYARSHDAVGHAEIAEKYYKMTLEQDNRKCKRRSAGYQSTFGQFLLRQERVLEALTAFETADALKPNNAYLQWKLAVVHHLMHDHGQRNLYLQRALDLNPNLHGAINDYHRWNMVAPAAMDRHHGNPEDRRSRPMESVETGVTGQRSQCEEVVVGDLKQSHLRGHEAAHRPDAEDMKYPEAVGTSTSSMSEAYTTASRYHPTNQHEKEVESR